MLMMIRSTKLTPPPPVPPRPNKTIVAEALAKSRKLSPVRALYATQPLSVGDLQTSIKKNLDGGPISPKPKPVIPVRTAPPPPSIKPKPNGQIAQPQVTKSFSSAMVFKPLRQNEENRVIRSASDVSEDVKTRTVVYQSSNLKTSKIEVNLIREPSVKEPINRVETTNEQNILNTTPNNPNNETNTKLIEEEEILKEIPELNPIDKVIDVIVQSSDKTTIIVTNTNTGDDDSCETPDELHKKVQFDDKVNHEILIAELQSMKEEQERFLKRQRKAPVEIYDCDSESVNNCDATRIQHSDWIEVANNGEEVRLSSCQIYIDNSDESSKSSSFSSSSSRKPQRVPSMSSLHGLPPLPKSLSGFNLLDNSSGHRVETPRGSYRVSASPGPQTPSRPGSSRGTTPPTPGSGTGHVVYPPHPRVNGTSDIPRGRKITTLDTQLAVLRREMYGLRQLDLSLLSQLYSLNEAIQDFRQMLQDQEDSALSPNSPSPSPSSGDEGDEFYSPAPMRYKPAPPAPPLRRTSNSSSANSSEYGTV